MSEPGFVRTPRRMSLCSRSASAWTDKRRRLADERHRLRDYAICMKRILGRTVIGLIVTLAILYLGDWGVWRARVAMGGGMGTVSVSRIEVATLKNHKEE